MRKRLRKSIAGILALLMVVGSFQLNGLQVKAEEPTTEDLTFTMEELGNPTETGGVTVNDLTEGKQELSFPGNYKTIFWAVPEELKDSEITQIKYNVEAVTGEEIEEANAGKFGYKIFTEEMYTTNKWSDGVGSNYEMYGNPTRVVPTDLEEPIKY
ncbi:MAG: hypothetical protein J6L65_10840, partial [Lachnospiraceae bacterium]|nr:hypothetical protein [Lachnospiraceae bacterium]